MVRRWESAKVQLSTRDRATFLIELNGHAERVASRPLARGGSGLLNPVSIFW